MGPSKSRGTGFPLLMRTSLPEPMSCKALPTLPPPTMTAGTTLVGALTAADAMTEKDLVEGSERVEGEIAGERKEAMF